MAYSRFSDLDQIGAVDSTKSRCSKLEIEKSEMIPEALICKSRGRDRKQCNRRGEKRNGRSKPLFIFGCYKDEVQRIPCQLLPTWIPTWLPKSPPTVAADHQTSCRGFKLPTNAEDFSESSRPDEI